MNVCAPGKLILSGEHAVVYGYPALAMAVNRYVEAEIQGQRLPVVSFDLMGGNGGISGNGPHPLSFTELDALRLKIRQKYSRFQQGELGVRDILKHPVELMQFALSVLFEAYPRSASTGIHLRMQSSIPIGCGMGSSAAAILSVLVAAARYFQWEVSQEILYRLGLEAENMQHGKSSGIDLQTALQGGCIYRQGQEWSVRAAPEVPMYLVHTGTPQVSTGECVARVAPYFTQSKIGDDFAAVTNQLNTILLTYSSLSSQQALAGFKEAIRENHQLLKTIGVVPEKVACFIREIEEQDGAAKICGAGAIAGDQAGVVLIMTEDEQSLKHIHLKYGYAILPIQCVPRGVYVE